MTVGTEGGCVEIFYALEAGDTGDMQAARVVVVSFLGDEARYGAFILKSEIRWRSGLRPFRS